MGFGIENGTWIFAQFSCVLCYVCVRGKDRGGEDKESEEMSGHAREATRECACGVHIRVCACLHICVCLLACVRESE